MCCSRYNSRSSSSYNSIDSRYTSTSRDTSRYNRYGSRYNSYNTCIYHLV